MLRAPELVAAARRTSGRHGREARSAARLRVARRGRRARRLLAGRVARRPERAADPRRRRRSSSRAALGRRRGSSPYDRLVIATGSSPAIPPIDGLDEVDYWTNIEATETLEVPARLARPRRRPGRLRARAVLPARSGSQVTLVQGGTRLLPRVDADAAALVDDALREDGVDIRLDATAEPGQPVTVCYLPAATSCRSTACWSRPAGGRTSTGSSALGLTITTRGVEVDERLRAAEDVWAIGDVTGIAPFTHVGKYHARIAATTSSAATCAPTTARSRPTIFTDPQVATVGDTRGRRRVDLDAAIGRRASRPTSARSATGFVKVVADPERRVLTGAVAVGPGVGRVAAAADARDPRRDADRGAARRDPALPDVQRRRLLGAARAEPRPVTRTPAGGRWQATAQVSDPKVVRGGQVRHVEVSDTSSIRYPLRNTRARDGLRNLVRGVNQVPAFRAHGATEQTLANLVQRANQVAEGRRPER